MSFIGFSGGLVSDESLEHQPDECAACLDYQTLLRAFLAEKEAVNRKRHRLPYYESFGPTGW